MHFQAMMLGMVCKFIFWLEEKLVRADFIFSLNELDFEINWGKITDFWADRTSICSIEPRCQGLTYAQLASFPR